MKKLLITLMGLYCANFIYAQNVTTAGNGLYKPTTSSLALSDGSTTVASPIVFDFGTNSLSNFSIKKGSNSYLSIANDGKVGIGIANPFFNFHVNGQSAFNGPVWFSDNNNGIYISNGSIVSSHEGGIYADGDIPLAVYDWDNYASRYGNEGIFSISSATSVEIGKFFPANHPAKLDVNGSIFCNKKIFIGTADANTATKIAPYALAVNGDAIFNKAKVKLYSAWPDYVFKNDYQLPSLEEIELFIKKNRHLPGVPSEKEVNENGIDLGGMQSVLLEKVEQLTLYMIELNKKVNQLEKENESLKAALKNSAGAN